MISALERLFTSSVAFGDGIACVETPFQSTLVFDYYDGPIQGISRIKGSETLIYFEKVWWDEYQDSRLFEGWIFIDNDLMRLDTSMAEFIERGIFAASAGKPPVELVDRITTSLIQAIKEQLPTIRCHIFCRQITRELFILPLVS